MDRETVYDCTYFYNLQNINLPTTFIAAAAAAAPRSASGLLTLFKPLEITRHA